MRKLLLILLVTSVAATAHAQARTDKPGDAGWAALQQGDASTASTAFEEALSRGPRDAALYYGAGAAAYLLGRHQEAADRLTRALALNPKLVLAGELLGELEYLQGDSEAAIQRYERMLPFAAERSVEMRKRLDGWRHEGAVHRDLTVRDEARFSVLFDGRSDNFLAGHATALLERAFTRIGEKLGAFPSKRIVITLYSGQQFRDITDAPEWSAGVFDGKIRIPVQGAAQDIDDFDRVLVHEELTHAIIADLAPQRIPTWLNEGLATYFDNSDAGLAQRRIERVDFAVPLSWLEGSFRGFTAAQAAFAYDESLVAADLLLRLTGPRMAVLLQALGRGQSFEQSMGHVGLQASEFEAQVMRHLKP